MATITSELSGPGTTDSQNWESAEAPVESCLRDLNPRTGMDATSIGTPLASRFLAALCQLIDRRSSRREREVRLGLHSEKNLALGHRWPG